MRRLLLIVLAVLLPLQLAWANLGDHCAAAGHTHEAVQADSHAADHDCHGEAQKGSGQCDHSCHHLCTLIGDAPAACGIEAHEHAHSAPLPRPSGAPGARPERPNWPPLA